MKADVDTNVAVSGLLTHHGVCAEVIDRMRMGAFQLCVNGPILAEYAEVLSRPELSIPVGATRDFLDFVRHRAECVDAALSAAALPDQSDRPFLEVARAAEAVLVTGNTRHFPKRACGDVAVCRSAEFLELIRRSS